MPRAAARSSRIPKPLVDLAKAYVGLPTGSFNETRVHDFLRQFAEARGLTYREDSAGNALIEYRRGRKTTPLVLGAHTDHPGFVVTKVNGRRLELEFRGGIPGEYGKGERIRLYSADPREDRGDSTAEITSTVLSDAANRWAKRLIGAKATLTAGSTAQVGDLALWDVEPARVRGSILHARSCDDLGGGLAILWALEQLVAQQPDAHVLGLFTRAEEVGLVGAAAVTMTGLLPAGALIVAVECSSMAGGRAVQGEGPVIRVGDAQHIFSPRITMWMTRVALELQQEDPAFGFQRKLMDGGTTEATAYDLLGYESGAACLALGNYHNMGPNSRIAAETLHLGDVEGLARLFVAMGQNTRRVDEVYATAVKRWRGIAKDAASQLRGR
ncbi:MAG: M20/M25/M40 family metallo-hydrolase [Dehalococcoidia bacterium]|nr:M20/M25/M40 family metallo-hydrolase [Dehalococcoidia bacterium]